MVQINSIEKGSRPTELIAGVLGIWEASVRASHHFLTEDDIRSLCPQAEEAISGGGGHPADRDVMGG